MILFLFNLHFYMIIDNKSLMYELPNREFNYDRHLYFLDILGNLKIKL